ncbi:MAG: hypothetical protein IJT73_08165 [Selenomonadaceae bacterium]|nr:hypothetical protein [Selenomonadaceae bacterium]
MIFLTDSYSYKRTAVNIEFVERIFLDNWSSGDVKAKMIDAQGCSGDQEITIKSCDSEEEAKNYLITFAKQYNFLLYDDDKAAINPARIRSVYIDHKYFHTVCAEVDGYCLQEIRLKEFNYGDYGKEQKDAEDYLAKVVKFLSGGAQNEIFT